ncbi:MAG: hypothetical protein H0T05_02210 [Acidobacteria bacterium]|nr:hypothetical protein [Acidobacteriota bacterium]
MPILTRSDFTRLRVLTGVGILTLFAVLVRLALFDVAPGSTMFHPHHLAKPVTPDQLIRIVAAALGR